MMETFLKNGQEKGSFVSRLMEDNLRMEKIMIMTIYPYFQKLFLNKPFYTKVISAKRIKKSI